MVSSRLILAFVFTLVVAVALALPQGTTSKPSSGPQATTKSTSKTGPATPKPAAGGTHKSHNSTSHAAKHPVPKPAGSGSGAKMSTPTPKPQPSMG